MQHVKYEFAGTEFLICKREPQDFCNYVNMKQSGDRMRFDCNKVY